MHATKDCEFIPPIPSTSEVIEVGNTLVGNATEQGGETEAPSSIVHLDNFNQAITDNELTQGYNI